MLREAEVVASRMKPSRYNRRVKGNRSFIGEGATPINAFPTIGLPRFKQRMERLKLLQNGIPGKGFNKWVFKGIISGKKEGPYSAYVLGFAGSGLQCLVTTLD
ncbi:hypothetical protein Salat_2538000 [Sesamum alatum]|uniref:Uncharacterized protein n=1 Tax=Sesamum alatum TaxID=300844 RepID=A0AAE2CCL8_9LAMI|nr:hypothetical protein Salat_2538000 [Sesamum alatum]